MPRRSLIAVIAAVFIVSCSRRSDPVAAAWVSITEAEAIYGRLITTGNHPTPNQYGTGERVGIFAEAGGTLWGLPLVIAKDGKFRACAPAAFRSADATGTYPAGAEIIGTSNAPTGWRGGTGNLELIFRNASGAVTLQAVGGAYSANGPVCNAPATPGPPQQLSYFRLTPINKGNNILDKTA